MQCWLIPQRKGLFFIRDGDLSDRGISDLETFTKIEGQDAWEQSLSQIPLSAEGVKIP